MRRDQEWQSTKMWTKEDKEKYERSRRRQEKEIAMALKPDPYMIIEQGPNDTRASTHMPWMDILGDPHVWHTAGKNRKMTNTGDIANCLESTY